jgi:hypothetical protein
VPRLDRPSAFDDIRAMAGRSVEHPPKVDLGKAAIAHSLEQSDLI